MLHNWYRNLHLKAPGVPLAHPTVVTRPQYYNITALGSNTNNPVWDCWSACGFLMQTMECYDNSTQFCSHSDVSRWRGRYVSILFFLVACTPWVLFRGGGCKESYFIRSQSQCDCSCLGKEKFFTTFITTIVVRFHPNPNL